MSSEITEPPSQIGNEASTAKYMNDGGDGVDASNAPTTADIPHHAPAQTTTAAQPEEFSVDAGAATTTAQAITINVNDDNVTDEGYGAEGDDGNPKQQRYSTGYSDDVSYNPNKELYLSEEQKDDFRDRLLTMGKEVPEDEYGRPIFTKVFVKSLPKKIAHEILAAARENYDLDRRSWSSGSDYSSFGSTTETSRKSRVTYDKKSISTSGPDSILALKYSPSGTGFVADVTGQKLTFEDTVRHLEHAFTEQDLQKLEVLNHEKTAALLLIIRKQRKEEEGKSSSLKKTESFLELQEMALRYIPEVNIQPNKTDELNLFEHLAAMGRGKVFPSAQNKTQQQQRGVDFIHLLDPRDFAAGRVDSLATVPSTVERKFSNATVRGSLISTHLSEMPSTFSQALVDDPSVAIMASSDQVFDISPNSAAKYRENWLSNYMRGFTPKNTFIINIINLITRKFVELRVNKENTLNEICHMYMNYDDMPQKYVWKDIYGRVLHPQKTLVENGMMGQDEKMEFGAYRKSPVILLHFRDGFEDDPPLPLNPIFAMKQKQPGLCRNY